MYLILFSSSSNHSFFQGTEDEEAQKALLYRTTCNSLASNGKYDGEEQTTGLMKSLHTENYAY